jgi:uncharacterized protein (DUF4415 family)
MPKRTTRPPSAQPGRRRRSARGDTTAGSPPHGAVPGNGDATPRGKTRLTMYLDLAVVEHFRSRAGGRGYQTLINEALKQAIEQESLENTLRRVIREEARPYQTEKGKS